MNTPKARIVQEVVDQKSQLQLRLGLWEGFIRCKDNLVILWVEYKDPIDLMEHPSNIENCLCLYKKCKHQVDLQSYWSFDEELLMIILIFWNNDCISYYDIYYRLICSWATSRGWKSLQQQSSILRFCILHMIGVECYLEVYFYTYVDDYIGM